MVVFHGDGEVSVELFVRRDLPRPSRRRSDAIDAELRTLAAEGDVAEYRQRAWPKRIRVPDCADEFRDRYLTVSAWAKREDLSLQPFFDTRERYDTDAEAYSDCIVFPTMAVLVFTDGALSAVYPHTDGGETVTVEDGIERLREELVTPDDESVAVAD